MSAARRKLGWVGAMALVATAVVATPSAAAPGDLDAGFGSGGIRGGVPGQPESVAEAPDGKVVTVSSVYTGGPDTIHVRRFTAAGAPDSSFSGGGALTLTTGTGPRPQVYVDPAGRIVVASASSSGFQVWRFEADGDLDPTFSGDGTVPLSVTTAGFAQIGGIGRQPDGDLVIQVNDSFPIGGIAQRPKLVRVTDAGVEAQTVEVLADFTESNAGSLAATALDATGRSYVLLPDDGRLIVRRYTAALALDATYSGDGIIAVTRPGGAADNENWGGAISVSDDGSALVTGTVGTYTPNGALPPTVVQQATLLARLTSAGTLDTGFSGDGLVALARPSGSISPDTVDQAASGGAVVVASRSDGDSSTVVWQIRAGGDPETGFSGDGRLERSAYGKTARVVQSGARLLLFESAASQSQLAALQLVAPAPVAGSVYVPITPCRVLDTRSGGGALTNANARPVQVGGTGAGFAAQGGKPGGCGVPDGASAVAASITAVTPTANGFLRAWPTGVAEPGATFLNFTKAQNTTNTGAITLAATGTNDLTVKAAGATVHVVIDVQGYFVAPPT